MDHLQEQAHSANIDAVNAIPAEINSSTDTTFFAAELRQLQTHLGKKPHASELHQLRNTLPPQWIVTTPERCYSISTAPLDKLLESAEKNPTQHDAHLIEAQRWVGALANEIEASFAKSSGSLANEQATLQSILARSEFRAAHQPSPMDLFRQRLNAWLQRMFLGALSRYPIGGKILFWLIMIGGVVWISFLLIRFWSSTDRMHVLQPNESVLTSRTWQEWIRIAREAANRGDFREAVHSAYWAGIVRLEDAGVVPKDRTKTPREYLRLVSDPAPGELTSRTAHREPLGVLTTLLEKIWYAKLSANSEDFRNSLRQLEALGCQLE